MHRRKIEDEQDARACLKRVAESGMERTPWARANGVDARSLHAWWLALERRKKHECGLTRSSVRLVEVVAEPAPARASYWIHVDGMVVEVDDNFQEATLRRLLAAVQSC